MKYLRYLLYFLIFISSFPLNHILGKYFYIGGKEILPQTIFAVLVITLQFFLLLAILLNKSTIIIPRPILYFLFYVIISSFISRFNNFFFNFLLRVFYILIFCISFLKCFKFNSFKKVKNVLIFSGIVTEIIGLYLIFKGSFSYAEGRIMRFIGFGSVLTHAFGMSFYFAIGYLLWRFKEISNFTASLLLTLSGFQIILTGSRGALLSVLAAIILVELLMGKKNFLIIFLLVLSPLYLDLVFNLSIVEKINDYLPAYQRIIWHEGDIYTLTGGRYFTTMRLLALIKENPQRIIFGYGPGENDKIVNTENLVYSHNIYLDLFFDLGITGLYLFLYIFYYFYKRIKLVIRNTTNKNTETIVAFLALLSLFLFLIRGAMDTVLHTYLQTILYFIFPLLAISRRR